MKRRWDGGGMGLSTLEDLRSRRDSRNCDLPLSHYAVMRPTSLPSFRYKVASLIRNRPAARRRFPSA